MKAPEYGRIGESLGKEPISTGAEAPHLSLGRHFFLKVLNLMLDTVSSSNYTGLGLKFSLSYKRSED